MGWARANAYNEYIMKKMIIHITILQTPGLLFWLAKLI